MQRIFGKDLPEDHPYYRSFSPSYKTYLHKCGLTTFSNPDGSHGWIKNAFWLFQLAKLERTKNPPSLESLRKAGFERGFVIWVPATDKIPTGWRRLFLQSHFRLTGFTHLNPENYKSEWNSRAKRAAKKFCTFPDTELKLVDVETFAQAYEDSKVQMLFRKDFIRYYRKLLEIDPSKVRSWIVYQQSKPVAGLAVHDYLNSSVHLVAFTCKQGKPIQAGTALIDEWFRDSVRMGLEYINFDHLRDSSMSPDQQGYTDFKKNFMQYQIEYPMGYFRWIGKDE